jgi:hypothetical protein
LSHVSGSAGLDSEKSMNLTFWAPFWAPANRKKFLVALGLVLVLVGAWALWYCLADPLPAWVVRWKVTHYLKKQAGSGDFKIEFPFPSKAEMAKAPAKKEAEPAASLRGSRTGKGFDMLAAEYLKRKTEAVILDREVSESEVELEGKKPQLEELKRQLAEAQAGSGATNLAELRSKVNALGKQVAALEKKTAARSGLQAEQTALEPIVRDLWEIQRLWAAEAKTAQSASPEALTPAVRRMLSEVSKKMGEATSYAAIYHCIGQELWVARRLFQSANPVHRRAGLDIALQASRHALDPAVNAWLAARICEGYLWPNLDVADTANRQSPLSLDGLLNECARLFRENDELPNVARNYQILLAKAESPQRADWARVQIAMAHEQSGNLKAALHYLRQVKSTNDFRWAVSRIPQMEKRLGSR